MTVLIVLTSHDTLGNTGRKTGMWLEEFLSPYYRFVDTSTPVRLASPAGGEAPIDPASIDAIKSSALFERYSKDSVLQRLLKNTERLQDVDPATIDGVLYPGGHGPVWDLREDAHSLRIIERLHAAGKPVATICHAGCVLLNARKPDGSPLLRDAKVTAFSDGEEEVIQLHTVVPYGVEAEMRRLGAVYSRAPDWEAHVVQHDHLLTGQNPASSVGVANGLIAALTAKSSVERGPTGNP